MFGRPRPNARMVAKRAAILKCVAISSITMPPRTMLDEWMANWTTNEQREFLADLEARRSEVWGGLGDLRGDLTPWENEYFRCPYHEMPLQMQADASWRLEAFQVLIWSLGVVHSLPDVATPARAELANEYTWKDGGKLASLSRLRPQAVIDRQREVAELWHWRSRTRQIIEEGRAFPTSLASATEFRGYDDVVRSVAEGAEKDGVTTRVNGDFSLLGKAYRDLTADEWSSVRSITVERHFALNWLCGRAPKNRWDETPTET